jgi:hypothetical protein
MSHLIKFEIIEFQLTTSLTYLEFAIQLDRMLNNPIGTKNLMCFDYLEAS